MMKIGVVGEDPNDTDSIINLMRKPYKDKAQFVKLAERVSGSALGTDKLLKIIVEEFAFKKCKLAIITRDLDGLRTETKKIKDMNNWFDKVDSKIHNKGIFLLNIYELEALIMANIKTFNKTYNTKYKFSGDPSLQNDPKATLKHESRKHKKPYHVNTCSAIFAEMDFDSVVNNCNYFGTFIKDLNKRIAKGK